MDSCGSSGLSRDVDGAAAFWSNQGHGSAAAGLYTVRVAGTLNNMHVLYQNKKMAELN